MFSGQRNAALETQERVPWVAPDDAESSDIDVSPLDIESDDDDPTYVPDEGLTQDGAFDLPNSRDCKVNVVPQAMPMEEEPEPNPKRSRADEWKKENIDIHALPNYIPQKPGARNSLGTRDFALPRRGQQAVLQNIETRQNATALHMPKRVTMRQTCKFCSGAGHIHSSRWLCEDCKVALCLTEERNCFALFHKISK
ncbi:uncharacterized protein LOC135197058 [Macrobrachium nipponense]|uniref:uncharacterized protein LOC135197058 n=1 Tax=Macrobrachium nipponense TaxID=159736 RepID=UPI0030C7FEE2